MVKIRLQRVGAKHQPYYRVVVVDSRVKRDGKVLENIGHYNPIPNPPAVEIKKDRLEHWRGVGAQISEAVMVLLGEAEPKKHQPKNVKKEEAPTSAPASEALPEGTPAEGAAKVETDAPETTPEPSPELAEAVANSEQASPEATPEEIAETTEASSGVTGAVPAEEDQPTSQEEPVDLAESAEETDDPTTTEK